MLLRTTPDDHGDAAFACRTYGCMVSRLRFVCREPEVIATALLYMDVRYVFVVHLDHAGIFHRRAEFYFYPDWFLGEM